LWFTVCTKRKINEAIKRKSSKVSIWNNRSRKDEALKTKRRCKVVIGQVDFNNILRTAFTLVGPKRTKWHWWLDCLFAHLGSVYVKAERKLLMKLTLGLSFTNTFMYSFYALSSQKRKNSVKLSVSFCAFGIYWRKSCS